MVGRGRSTCAACRGAGARKSLRAAGTGDAPPGRRKKSPGLLLASRPGLTGGRGVRSSSAATPFDWTGSATCLTVLCPLFSLPHSLGGQAFACSPVVEPGLFVPPQAARRVAADAP